MYQVHDWAEVHRLFHREGWTKTKIADELGMSRNTVTRLLVLSEPPRYVRAGTGSKLDPHKGSIARMLGVDPKVPATVIIEHLRRDGYEGGITLLKDYLVGVRPDPGQRGAPGRSRWRTRTGAKCSVFTRRRQVPLCAAFWNGPAGYRSTTSA